MNRKCFLVLQNLVNYDFLVHKIRPTGVDCFGLDEMVDEEQIVKDEFWLHVHENHVLVKCLHILFKECLIKFHFFALQDGFFEKL